MTTLAEATQKLENYPYRVRFSVDLVEVPYAGYCKRTGYKYEVTTASFDHEMGHASAKVLGIEKELGEMMISLIPNSTSVTNENWLCYPAQHLAGEYRTDYAEALGEYAAEGIRAYTEGWELPEDIREFIAASWNS